MPNAPKPAARKRKPPAERRNAQADHEGSPHRPEEFQKAESKKPERSDQFSQNGEGGNGDNTRRKG